MEFKLFVYILFLGCASAYLDFNVPSHKEVFNQKLLDDVLDSEKCDRHIEYLRENTNLMLRFVDSSFRLPKGFLDGNFADYGNYRQCLGINHESEDTSTIEGKYCMIQLPLEQDLDLPSLPELPEWPDIDWPEWPWPELNSTASRFDGDTLTRYKKYKQIRNPMSMSQMHEVSRVASDSSLAEISLLLAVCIPKACTTRRALDEIVNITRIGLEYDDAFCRLPGDKQWVVADYLFLAIFGFLACLVILSTCYDLHHNVVHRNDGKKVNNIYLSFSVYTNTRRLVTYNPAPGTIECLDGIRALAMMWVIVGHTYVNQTSFPLVNPLDVFNWLLTAGSLWITLAPITVDTFFMLSGLLLVYTTVGKLSKSKLVKNLHLFYLNRLLRMFPLLGAIVLMQASLFNWLSDGPYWTIMSSNVENCRVFWWSTLLHIQNYVSPNQMCLTHTWYLAIDVQLHIISPIFLYWVLGSNRRSAWISIMTGLLLSLVGATVYNFMKGFQPNLITPSRGVEDQLDYGVYYYVNTLTRASPFFVGMIYGYLLHMYKGQKLVLTKFQVAILWACAIAIFASITVVIYLVMQVDWDNKIMDGLINSFKRPAWALAVGWIIFASAKGYGGPINWFLSLRCFKVLSRLSYAMYIVHFPLIFVVESARLNPGYFDVIGSLFKFLADFTLAAIAAYILTMLVDAPCSTLIKTFLGGPSRPPPKNIVHDDKVANGHGGAKNHGYESDDMKTNL